MSKEEKEKDEAPPAKLEAPEGLLDHATFEQLLDMDDEEDHEFSKSIVYNYFEQAEQTFKDMDEALSKEDPAALSRLGHFLKGSSAALGLQRVKTSCEKMQHYGNLKDQHGSGSITQDEALDKIRELLVQVKEEYKEADTFLRKFYGEDVGGSEEAEG